MEGLRLCTKLENASLKIHNVTTPPHEKTHSVHFNFVTTQQFSPSKCVKCFSNSVEQTNGSIREFFLSLKKLKV